MRFVYPRQGAGMGVEGLYEGVICELTLKRRT